MATTAAPQIEDPKKTLAQHQNSPSDLNPSASAEHHQVINAEAIKKDDGDETKTVSGATTTAVAANDDSGTVTNIQKKISRAERFSMPVQLSEEEKRNSRAERFGTAAAFPRTDALKKSEEQKRKARAERFGTVKSLQGDEEAKKAARLARFAPYSKADSAEEDKKKARAIRFAQPMSSSLAQVNGKGDAGQGKMREEEVNRCQIQEWYPKFKLVSMKTVIHELPESFVQYLLDDSGPFLLPTSVCDNDALPNRIHKPEEEEDYAVQEGSEDESEQPSAPPSFPELEVKIKESIESLGGEVFPKLNWSAPKDSAWISSTGNLKCTSFSDIALLFRSSDSLIHDLCHAYDSCRDKTSSRPSTFYLALRKWYDSLSPEREFRCFVHGQLLVGICQREVTNFYPVLLEKKKDLEVMIRDFFVDKVQLKFESENYTFDVYITADGRVKLLDFNPWGAFTLPLLFTWDELEENFKPEGNGLEFRIVESRCGVRPGLKTAVPYDYLDTSPGSGWDEFLRNADKELRRQKSSGAGA